jgi:hypothetical protein
VKATSGDSATTEVATDGAVPPTAWSRALTISARANTRRLAWVLSGTLGVLLAGAAVAFLWAARGHNGVGLPAGAEPALVRLTSNPTDMSVTTHRAGGPAREV